MDAGEYNRKLSIERKVPGKKGLGGAPSMTYEPTGKSFFASRRTLRGQEKIAGGEATATQETEWKTWYRTDINVSDRLVYKRRNREGNTVTYTEELHEVTEIYSDSDHCETVILTRHVDK
ncbi:MAG: hypothetical protein K2X93_06700 [Candidatus Obscuribacterales bacterium]|nr:hypothetical protein [Candidatus Obscuribacterales bacterium]